MQRPKNIIDYGEIDLKLGIKSSLPHVKSTVAMAILLWESNGRPATLVYSEQHGDEIVIDGHAEDNLVTYISNFHAIGNDFEDKVNQNQLFKSQMESLGVAFELVWKIAKVDFVDKNKSASAERTGGIRFPKELSYSLNMDILHSVIENDESGYIKILLSWIGEDTTFSTDQEKILLGMLTALSESAVFKLSTGTEDIIFRQDGIYQALLEESDPVNIDDFKEAKGPLRILKSLLSDGMNPYLKGSGQNVTANQAENLTNYQARVSTYLRLSATKITNTDIIPDIPDPKVQKERFRNWHEQQLKSDGNFYSSDTVKTRISAMETGFSRFKENKDYDSVFQIQNAKELSDYINALTNDQKFVDYDKRLTNHCSKGLNKYLLFLDENECGSGELCFATSLQSPMPRNRIVFGAPGTGKSYTINKERKELLGEGNETDYERVTFHPDYSYANFVGTYKPVPCKDADGKDAITYEYVSGPFMRLYVKALKNGRTDNPRPFLLIIEEINRANVAAVFGDVFQLLDRGDDNTSEYPIEASEDIKKYLAKELGGEPDDYAQIRIPDNMFIWATMNSADQGVFPMDTAFKRRWDFTYLGIDDSDEKTRGKYVLLADDKSQKVEWNKLRKAINNFLAKEKINEDKQLGPYFISRNIVAPEDGDEIDRERFIHTFKDKVIMYLFEDAAKQKRARLFEGCFQNSTRYSEICREFDEKGIGIFNHEIQLEAEPETVSGAVGEADE